MSKYLGLFLFILSFSAFGKELQNSSLHLRGFVPVMYKVNVVSNGNTPKVEIKSNRTKEFLYPKSSVKRMDNTYLVSIVHP